MKRINSFLLISLFLGTVLMPSCKKNNDHSQAEITENNIQAVLDSIITNTHVPGLVAGIWAPNEGIDFVYAAGLSDLETKDPMSPDMIFRVGSNTKTFTITVLLQLVDEGLISLDDRLSDYLPDFPRADEVTIEMLTNMRSGIYNYSEDEEFMGILMEDLNHVYTFEDIINYVSGKEYYFDPGTDFHYSNSNTFIAAQIIENITGKSIEENITSRLIEPMNLINTKYLTSGIELPGYHSKGYYAGTYDPELPEFSELANISWAGPAGSVISTIFDLKQWVIALINGDFLSEPLQTRRMNSMHDAIHNLSYGIGLLEKKGFYGHTGGLPGYTSLMVHSPEKNCTMIIWYNCQIDATTPADLLPNIAKIIYPDSE